ncbi:MAG: hypothetical protein NDJ94_22865, partial [Vicinamibacteria bacterium]|nr:hypothetical protein [Vicinamibacteria bacterium]
VKEGDQILVKVVSIDPSGKIRLSRKALLPVPEGHVPEPEGEGHGPSHGREHGGREHRGGPGGRGGSRDRDRGPRRH